MKEALTSEVRERRASWRSRVCFLVAQALLDRMKSDWAHSLLLH